MREDVISVIREYLSTERKNSRFNESEYLLVSNRSSKLDRDAVAKRLKKYGRMLDIKLNPHIFRHTFCTNLVKKNVNISTVSKLAGHANINTTNSYYLNVSAEDKQSAVDML
jgi:integrase/recombinase XerD